MAHVADWKYDEVKKLTDFLINSKVIGIVEIGGIPAPQMQQMRGNLHGIASIRSAKNRLIFRAIDEAEKKKKGISRLREMITGQTAIISTDMNPFKLFNQLKKTRSMAPAKGGETVQKDIEVKAGETSFKPGPIVGELQKVGIPAAIQDGKVVIKSDKVVVNAGEKIPAEVAQMLTRLEIFPIEIGMNLNGVFEDGNIFQTDILDIDVDEFIGNMKKASFDALILGIELGWASKETVMPLLMKAHQNAFILAIEQGISNKDTIKHLISKANANMNALKSLTT